MTTIALFGTSADPPTAGHQKILNWLSYHFDEVWVWASDNPYKTHQTRLAHRATMLRLLIADIRPPRSNIHCNQTLSDPKALVTVERAEQQCPEAEFTLVVGADLVSQIHRWYRAAELFQRVTVLVIPRPGYDIPPEAIDRLQHMGATVAIATMTGLPVSSTAYREEHDAETLTPPVKAYIHQEQLYECQDPPQSTLPTR